jgi:hypothetical protein
MECGIFVSPLEARNVLDHDVLPICVKRDVAMGADPIEVAGEGKIKEPPIIQLEDCQSPAIATK